MRFRLMTMAVAAATCSSSIAQMPAPMPIAPPVQPTGVIRLDSDPTPRAASSEQWMKLGGDLGVRNVNHPTLTPFLPPAGHRTGVAVVIAPGGAFIGLSIDAEGWTVARWFAAHGIAAFVLKYRTLPTPADTAGFVREAGRRMQALQSPDAARGAIQVPPEALADAKAAMRLVHSRALEWGIDHDRVGFVGFSAGAATAVAMALTKDPAEKPAFVAPIYLPMDDVTVPATAPPLFVAIAADDSLFGGKGYGLIEAWQKARRPVELHVFQSGGHGFGLGRPDTTTPQWPELFLRWLAANGIAGSKSR